MGPTMRDPVRAFCEAAVKAFDLPDPLVEFGSYQVAGQEALGNLRELFPGRAYVGCDMRAGPGVDRVEDVSAPSFRDGEVGTALCFETLEHVFEVRRAFDALARILRPGGVLVASAPFHFHVHAHPDDYWRLTPSAWRRLLQPYALRVVAALGPEKRPHAVLALAVKAPAPPDAEERARRFAADFEARLAGLVRARPLPVRLASAVRALGLSKGERRARAEFHRARITIEPAP
jgi:SAM-dependent methyltransferase